MKKLNISAIEADPDIQSRTDMDASIVEEYRELYERGQALPAITVIQDGTRYLVADGFHRLEAAKAAGLRKIDAEVVQGSRRDAILHSVGSNADHGLRRSNADKRRAVLTLLGDEEWSRWSDHQIAKACYVSVPMVGKYRPESICKSFIDSDVRTAVRNGTEYAVNTAGIGSKSAPEPDDSAGPTPPPTVASSPAEPGRDEPIDAEVKPRFEGDVAPPPAPPTDEEWLTSLPIRARLNDRCRSVFSADALAYRRVAEAPEMATLAKLVKSMARKIKHDPTRGEYLYRAGLFFDIPHPRSWLACGQCEGVGCDTCWRRGYAVAH